MRWIPVTERLPEEYDSIFKKYKNTDKWYAGMFEKTSDTVLVTAKYFLNTIIVKTAKLIDGKWNIGSSYEVLAWMSLPEPYKEEQ